MSLRRLAVLAVVCALIAASVLASSATTAETSLAAKVRVPRVVGKRLNTAIFVLRRAGLRVPDVGNTGGPECDGLFGCIILSRWVVCEQYPPGGRLVARGTRVKLFADRPGEC